MKPTQQENKDRYKVKYEYLCSTLSHVNNTGIIQSYTVVTKDKRWKKM